MDINSRGSFSTIIFILLSFFICINITYVNGKPRTWINPCGSKSMVKDNPQNSNETYSLQALETSMQLYLKTLKNMREDKKNIYISCPKEIPVLGTTKKPNILKSRKQIFKTLKRLYEVQYCFVQDGFNPLINNNYQSNSSRISLIKRKNKLKNLQKEGQNVLCEIESSINNTLHRHNFNTMKFSCDKLFKSTRTKIKSFMDVCNADLVFFHEYSGHLTNWIRTVKRLEHTKNNKKIKNNSKTGSKKNPVRHPNKQHKPANG